VTWCWTPGRDRGRFSIELARRGARVHVGDLSEVQLALTATTSGRPVVPTQVVARQRLDICDLAPLPDAAFDAVVCFGGPLSYVRDRAPAALAELVRVTKPGGHVLLSVMSAAGALRTFLPAVLDEHRRYGPGHVEGILDTGDLHRATNDGHEMHLFRWSELAALCRAHGDIVAAMAANFLTATPDAGASTASARRSGRTCSPGSTACAVSPARSTPAPTCSSPCVAADAQRCSGAAAPCPGARSRRTMARVLITSPLRFDTTWYWIYSRRHCASRPRGEIRCDPNHTRGGGWRSACCA
jgi:hypothetical protein